jgi:crotonobetainyl-CoA:carnitine CoA-transferase CaiB-like acyl-CoA transferase
LTAELWAALGGDPARAHDVEVSAPARYLPSRFDVDGVAIGSVSAALLAAAELAEARGAVRPVVAVDAEHVACAFGSERHMRRVEPASGEERLGFAPLSRFAPTRDGWIRTHANYPHHRRALLAALGVGEEQAMDAIAERDAEELETAIVAAGGAAAAVRTPDAWAAHPQGRAVAAERPVGRVGAAGAKRAGAERTRPLGPAPAARPADAVRVLDLTRVIAGPVATRLLAALGADVLRIDPPQMPEDVDGLLETCPGKRLVELDLNDAAAAETLHALLAEADVLVHGYRPGALTAFGIDDGALAERHPHLVVASLAAWGRSGPWAQRRGFDSLVQAASGIATTEGSADKPGALPVQALDHATGYLIAAGVLRELAARERGEEAAHLAFALAATAAELMRHPAPDTPTAVPDPERFRLTLAGVSLIAPPGTLDGQPLRWTHLRRPDAPRWVSRRG